MCPLDIRLLIVDFIYRLLYVKNGAIWALTDGEQNRLFLFSSGVYKF